MTILRNTVFIYNNIYLSLDCRLSTTQLYIYLKLNHKYVNTSFLPLTYNFINHYEPSVLKTMCFNDDNLPFSQEIKRTEIGHLFEHILIDKICHEKIAKGENEVEVNGNTVWNWEKDEYGSFHIFITTTNTSHLIFQSTLEKSIDILNLLFDYHKSGLNMITNTNEKIESNNKYLLTQEPTAISALMA